MIRASVFIATRVGTRDEVNSVNRSVRILVVFIFCVLYSKHFLFYVSMSFKIITICAVLSYSSDQD